MKTERFAFLTPVVSIADDGPLLTAMWRDECRRNGGEPVGEPIWQVVSAIPDYEYLFPAGRYPETLLRVEGDAVRQ